MTAQGGGWFLDAFKNIFNFTHVKISHISLLTYSVCIIDTLIAFPLRKIPVRMPAISYVIIAFNKNTEINI